MAMAWSVWYKTKDDQRKHVIVVCDRFDAAANVGKSRGEVEDVSVISREVVVVDSRL